MEVLLRENNLLKEENIQLKKNIKETKKILISHHAIDMENKSLIITETKRAHAKQVIFLNFSIIFLLVKIFFYILIYC